MILFSRYNISIKYDQEFSFIPFFFYLIIIFFSARINKLLQTIDPVSRTSDNKHESAINKTLIMQVRINNLRETLKTLQKSYDDALNQSQTAEILP